ncbi:VOC family protein [Nocardia gipuzkoensis]|uniref:VOC family protein n=1 Tax=Nocardia gipuzkoensis TaxID=2749991 RepID=UPI00237D4661|nr:VOC family protein [Nocardia gipuzkoensis]MDE1675480.1 VOC family protein [Nocardia gipuzkoensis]
MGICQLGYIGLGAKNPDLWKELLVGVLGMQSSTSDGDVLRFRYDDHDTRLLVHPDPADDLIYLGWQVHSPFDLDVLADTVVAAGIDVNEGSAADTDRRRVRRLVWFTDPDGLRTELFYGPLIRSDPVIPGRPHHGIVAGNLGAGHVVRSVQDQDRTVRFYCEKLGFRLSDYGRGRLAFLGCNARHHSMALMSASISGTSKGIIHFMIQAKELDDVGIAFDLCLDGGIPLVSTIGKHANDRSVSFYLVSPAGFEIEYGWNSIEVDESTWESGLYASGVVWGQHPPGELAERLKNRKRRW